MASSRRRARATNRRRHGSLFGRLPTRTWFWSLAKRLSARALPGLVILTVIGMASGASYLGYRWVTHSPRFAISEIKIEGNQALSHEMLAEILALGDDANIFRTDMDELEARLLANPWIFKASVNRSLPKGLEVEILEHSASAAIELDGLYLLNEEGHPFKRADPSRGELEGLCIITGLSREQYLAAGEDSATKLQYALEALSSYNASPKRPRLGELHLDARHGITLITYEDAIAIHLGSPKHDEFEDRYRTFDSAWDALDEEEHAAARAFRIADRTPSDQVTIAFAGN